MKLKDVGRPERDAIWRIRFICSCGSSEVFGMIWYTPAPASRSPSARATASRSSVLTDGASSPALVRWARLREVDTPSAPASTASRTSRRISARSSSVGGSSSAPRVPIT